MAKRPLRVTVVSRADVVLGVVDQALKRKVSAMGHTVRDKLLTEVLVGQRSGRWYRVPKTNRMYQASRPGEPPATRLSDLRKSYRVTGVKGASPNYHVQVGSALPYALYLENGTNRMAARPHLRPAIEAATPDFRAILGSDWRVQ